ncbi:MAG: hypothetical protein KC621_26210 [Myxococcales bacterium]|nr:hypothetical protein [Myxococcales bacterium]
MWWVSLALAQTCDTSGLRELPESLSVAWVSPLGRRSGGRWLWVEPTKELRELAAASGSVGRTLQALGLRKRDTDPHRRWKVVVFDVDRTTLCRPVPDVVERTAVAGVGACDTRRSEDPDRHQACGLRVDRATGDPTIQTLRAEWPSLASQGFCVLPMDRFVAESARR